MDAGGRSAGINLTAKRGKSIRQIAAELGRSPTTVSRVLHEPVNRPPAKQYRLHDGSSDNRIVPEKRPYEAPPSLYPDNE